MYKVTSNLPPLMVSIFLFLLLLLYRSKYAKHKKVLSNCLKSTHSGIKLLQYHKKENLFETSCINKLPIEVCDEPSLSSLTLALLLWFLSLSSLNVLISENIGGGGHGTLLS